ncbi:hypothetical protein DE146DRAFT_753435 [Phaeosphaeria sp. MPI-PUGE-AT-0046c]|nr:hypothetical protein DE146DRAFT_753435 [Phaeosphaeria sp. MPI-PUGE-AT-0046c]
MGQSKRKRQAAENRHSFQSVSASKNARKKARKRENRVLKRQLTIATSGVHVERAYSYLAEARSERHARARRLQQQILGPNRPFRGFIWISGGEEARATDADRLYDIKADIEQGTAIVYFADGSFFGNGTMGAGVAWQVGERQYIQSYHLGRHTGDAEDAELYAIAAALGKATHVVDKDDRIRLVRIYTDAQWVLRGLYYHDNLRFGPMLESKTALEGAYEGAEWLEARGVRVQLIWVKGHAQSEGNRWADRAAFRAVEEQISLQQQEGAEERSPEQEVFKTMADVPGYWKDLGPDWAEEWLARENARINRERLFRARTMTAHEDVYQTNEVHPIRPASPPRVRIIQVAPSVSTAPTSLLEAIQHFGIKIHLAEEVDEEEDVDEEEQVPRLRPATPPRDGVYFDSPEVCTDMVETGLIGTIQNFGIKIRAREGEVESMRRKMEQLCERRDEIDAQIDGYRKELELYK